MGVSMSVMEKFKEWCLSKGGTIEADYDEEEGYASCKFPDYLKSENVKEFARFLVANRRELRYGKYYLVIKHEGKQIGKYSEEECVYYSPLFDDIDVSAKYFSDIGVSGEVDKKLMKKSFPRFHRHDEVVDSYTASFGKSMNAVFNTATNEWMGFGDAGVRIPYEVVEENPDVIAKVFDKTREYASSYANEAVTYIKSYVKPAEERVTFLERLRRFIR